MGTTSRRRTTQPRPVAPASEELDELVAGLQAEVGLEIAPTPPEAGYPGTFSYHWHDPDDTGECENPVVVGLPSRGMAIQVAIMDRLNDLINESGWTASDLLAIVAGVNAALGIDLEELLDADDWDSLPHETQAARVAQTIRTTLTGGMSFGTVLSA